MSGSALSPISVADAIKGCLPGAQISPALSAATTKPLRKAAADAAGCIMGIDEAGRGPTLGPMVYGAAFCEASYETEMANRAFADSKTLKEEKREQLFSSIEQDDIIGFAIESISAAEISAQMLQPERNSLNVIANNATFGLITTVEGMGYKLDKVLVDTVGDATTHRERLERRFPHIAFVVCPKADALYPIVSAASIVAKVTRDRELKQYEFPERLDISRDFGCGYPSDPATKAWMKQTLHPVFGFPQLARFSWQPAARAMEESGPAVQWACDVEDEGQQMAAYLIKPGGKRAANGSGGISKASSGAGRPSFFRSRRIERMTSVF